MPCLRKSGREIGPQKQTQKHTMKYNEKDYLRVTEILNPFSGYALIDPEILRKASERGIKIHEHLDCLLKEIGLWGIDKAHQGYIDSAKFFLDEITHVYETEKRFYDDELMVTGQCDVICEYEGKRTLVDWKTSANVNKVWTAQGSAYTNLARNSGYEVEKVVFVKLSKDGKKPKIVEIQEDYQEFLTLYKVYTKYFKGKAK